MKPEPVFGSLFSGIGGFDLGLERAGWRCAWQIEIDRFCQSVLERHWPDVRRYGDIRTIDADYLLAVDLLCGGFPCQDVSVAGRRAGLAAPRSGLFYEFVRLARELRPRWLLLENVPGLLSSNGGDDFRVVLAALGDAGYGVAWRVLDARWFGVPQRRRRVFLVGRLGAPCPPEVLFEPEGVPGDPEESGAAGQDVAYPVAAGAGGSKFGSGRDSQDTFVAVALRLSNTKANGAHHQAGEAYTLEPSNRQAVTSAAVRRLTPTECERLQAFEDGWTCLCGVEPYSTRDCRCPDGPRYAALGNAVTVNVVEWLGGRLLAVTRLNGA